MDRLDAFAAISAEPDALTRLFLTPEHRAAAVARVDEQVELDTPAAWVLPVFPAPDGEGWATTTWRTRRGFLALVPGDSPAGLRLPLSSIAWTEGPDQPERSPFDPRGALPALDPATLPAGDVAPARVLPIDESPRTALAVQHRDGHLFVFLPPMSHLEDALELVGAVEGTAAETGHAVVLEGYPLPGDDRVRTMSVASMSSTPVSVWTNRNPSLRNAFPS